MELVIISTMGKPINPIGKIKIIRYGIVIGYKHPKTHTFEYVQGSLNYGCAVPPPDIFNNQTEIYPPDSEILELEKREKYNKPMNKIKRFLKSVWS